MKKKLLLLIFFLVSTAAFSQAQLVVSNTDYSPYYIPGTNKTYSISITNIGTVAATNVQVSQPIPGGIEYFSWWGSNGSVGVNDPIANNAGTLAVGATLSYTVEIEVPAGMIGTLVSTVTVTSSNAATQTVTDTDVKAVGADISVTNTNNQTHYIPGTTVTYTVTVTNNGPLIGANIDVTNLIPAGITSFNWSGNNAIVVPNTPLINNIPALAAGASVVYTITMQIPVGFTGPLTSTTTWTTPSSDPVPGCTQCTDTDQPNTGADVVLVNTDSQTTYTPGGTSVYTVTVTNNGPGVATDVHVTNAIPGGIPAGSFSWVGDNSSSGTGVALDDTIPIMASGESVVYTITVNVPAAQTAPITSTAAVTTTSTDPDLSCAQCSDTDTNGTEADIEVTNTDNNTVYVPGTNNTYVVTVTNNGPETAFGVHVVNAIPAGITAFSWTGTNGSSGTNVNLDNTIATLAVGQSVTYTITLGVPAAFTGPLTSATTVTTISYDPTPACTTCSDTDTQVVAGADLVVVKTDNTNTYIPGTATTYTITVYNNGPQAATDVNVVDNVPAGIPAANVSWTGPNGSGTGNINETFPTVNVGQTITYTVNVNIPGGFGPLTDLVNTVAVSSTTIDPNPGCPRCTDTNVRAGADIVTTKTDNASTFTPGTTVVYTINVLNTGPEVAQNVSVSDLVPAGIPAANVSWVGPATSGSGNINETFATVNVNQMLTYAVTVIVPSDFDQNTNLVNTVAVTSTTYDPNPDCLFCTDTDTPAPSANISAMKSDSLPNFVDDTDVTYNITILNQGPSDAVNILVSDALPAGILQMTWVGSNGTSGTGPLSDIIASLPVGGIATYAVTIHIPDDYHLTHANLVNTVVLDADTPDPVPACPTCTDTNPADFTYITVDNQTYTLTELVEDVLIHTDCAIVENISAVGWQQSDASTISYFHYNNSSFPIKEGVIISSAGAKGYEGHYSGGNNNAGTGVNNPGNNAIIGDLQAISNTIPLNNNNNLKDYSEIRFNFTPLTNTFSFNFLFASDEYGTWQCQFGDVFAFMLTDNTAGTPLENLAVIPNTNIPIGVTSIHDATWNGACPSLYPELFDLYAPSVPAIQTPANVKGSLVKMTASADVIPGHVYTIKLAVADLTDNALSTAVFLEAGSFNVGGTNLSAQLFDPEEFPDLVGPAAVCPNDTRTLQAGTSAIAGATYQWYHNDLLLNGETQYTLLIDEPGVYTVVVSVSGSACQQTDSIIVEYLDDMPLGFPDFLDVCENLPADLTQIEAEILNGLDPTNYFIQYHQTEQDALFVADPITNYTAYTGENNDFNFQGDVIYASVENLLGSACIGVRSFTLNEIPRPAVPVVANQTFICGGGYVLPALPVGQYYNTTDYASGGTPITAGTSVGVGTVWVINTNQLTDCISEASFDVSEGPCGDPITPDDIYLCDALPNDGAATFDISNIPTIALGSNDATLYTVSVHPTQLDADNDTSPINTAIPFPGTDGQQVFIRMENNNDTTDFDTTFFTLHVIPMPAIPVVADVFVCDEYELPTLPTGSSYNSATGGTGTAYSAGDIISTTMVMYVIAETGATPPLVPNCASEASFVINIFTTPAVPTVADVDACETYDLPALPAGSYYNTLGDGSGTTLLAGDDITTTQTIWVVSEVGTVPCRSSASFVVTVHDLPATPVVADVFMCDEYELPALPAGSVYNSATGGTGTAYAAGDFISTTMTMFVIVNGTAPASLNCSSEASFVINIFDTPAVPTVADIDACETYELLPLPTGSYYNTLADGSGTTLLAGDDIATTQTIWVVAENGTIPCRSSASFIVTIHDLPPTPVVSDVAVCGSYTLPALTAGSYNTQAGGTGTTLPVGYVINATQDVWVFDAGTLAGCFSEASFTVTINPIPEATISATPTTVCIGDAAPVITITGTGGTAPYTFSYDYNGGATVTLVSDASGVATFTVPSTATAGSYIFNLTDVSDANCNSAQSDTVTITVNALPTATMAADVTAVCVGGTSPVITFTGAGGTAPYTFSYTLDGAPFTAQTTAGSDTVTVTAPTTTDGIFTYELTGVSDANCSQAQTATVSITVNPLPTATITLDNATVCQGGTQPTVTFTGAGGIAPYTFDYTLGGTPLQVISNAAGVATVQIPTTAPGTIAIVLTGVAESGATTCFQAQSGSVSVTVDPLPAATVSINDTAICQDGTPLPVVTFTGASGTSPYTFTYTVSGTPGSQTTVSAAGQDTATVTLPTNNTGTFTVTLTDVSDANGCQQAVGLSVSLEVIAPPAVPATVTDIRLCDDNNDGVRCFDLNPAGLEATGGNPDLGYSFHLTLPDAQQNINAIPDPALYCNVQLWDQPIIIRVWDLDAPECASYSTFMIHVDARPTANEDIADFAQCDLDAPAGTEDFILTDHIGEIIANPAGITFTFHHSQGDAQTPANAIPAGPYNSAGAETIWVRLENAAGCVDVASFELVLWPLPSVVPLAPLTSCMEGSGQASFDLAAYANTVSQGIPGVTVSYYLNMADASVPTNPLPGLYVSTGGTVTVRLDNEHCTSYTTLDLIMGTGPAVVSPQAISECDDNNDCHALFDLTSVEAAIMGGTVPAGTTFSYHLTTDDAEQSLNAITDPTAYPNVQDCNQTITVRVTAAGNICPSYVQLDLSVILRPEAVEGVEYELCDNDGNGTATFVLTSLDDDILANTTGAGYTVQYYAQFADIAAGNPIVSTAGYESATATIWAVVSTAANSCTDTVQVSLSVFTRPTIAPIPAFVKCDTAPIDQHEAFILNDHLPQIVQGQTGLTVSFHHSETDAIGGLSPIDGSIPYVNVPPAVEFIWVRVENANGCYYVTGMDIRVEPLPMPDMPLPNSPLTNVCDGNQDGYAQFDLDAIAAYMLQSVPAGTMTLAFYLTQADALAGINEQSGIYTNNGYPVTQTIYVLATNDAVTGNGCPNILPFTLNVLATPIPATDLADLTVCDTNQDGYAQFDLTQYEAAITLLQQPGSGTLTFSYYDDLGQAQLGTGSLGSVTSYTNTTPYTQQIWVRAENAADCYSISSFMLQVDVPLAVPGAIPGIWSVCDGQAPGSGLATETWDLTTIVDATSVPGYDASLYTVTYYPSVNDAANGTNALSLAQAQAYVNTSNPQSIGIVITSIATGCSSRTHKTIQVLPLPAPAPLTAAQQTLTGCDQDGNGTAFFDLSQYEAQMANGDTLMTFQYFTSLADAEAGNDAAAIPAASLSNYESLGGPVYIRVEEATLAETGGDFCHVIVTLNLVANPQPQVTTYTLQACETNNTNTAVFDLTTADQFLLTSGSASDYTFTYYHDLVSAQASTGAIANFASYANTTNPEIVYVRVVNDATGCWTTTELTLQVNQGAVATAYAFPVVCDDDADPSDGIYVFDLTSANADILGTVQAADPQFTVSYYASPADVAAGTPIANPAAYATGTATLWAVVTNNTAAPATCSSDAVAVSVTVEPRLAVTVDGGQTICIDFTTGDLVSAPTLTAQPGGTGYTYEWFLDGTTTGVLTPTITADLAGDYTVIVTSAAGCVSGPSAPHTVVETSAPEQVTYTVSGAFQDHQSIQVSVQGQNPQYFEYSLDGGPWLANGGLFTNVAPGPHTIQVRSECGSVGPIDVLLINYPHYFTPNGDGIHDTWNTIGLDNDGKTKIYIFDRYGKLIKQIAPNKEGQDGWDGTYNGHPMPSTDYWF
ncbi:choice-of-anchor L domain-containing protein, partial [Flavobacterium sp.]|uniref:choice-of-anchor L domain-containing protein n=1 Tax=Flavobacterium sp. TaxID=239 RepID=UPI0025C505B6